jgi:hypothetical protein
MAEHILERLEKVRRVGTDRWSACCPAHEDRSPSLGIRLLSDGRILLNCFAGCPVDQVLAALGLNMPDLYPPVPLNGSQSIRGGEKVWNASGVLRAISLEALIVLDCARQLASGRSLCETDYASLLRAVARLQAAVGAVYG